jgi:hypothetical protein
MMLPADGSGASSIANTMSAIPGDRIDDLVLDVDADGEAGLRSFNSQATGPA